MNFKKKHYLENVFYSYSKANKILIKMHYNQVYLLKLKLLTKFYT